MINIGKRFNFILPKVNTDYIRQAQVLNIDNLRLIVCLWNSCGVLFLSGGWGIYKNCTKIDRSNILQNMKTYTIIIIKRMHKYWVDFSKRLTWISLILVSDSISWICRKGCPSVYVHWLLYQHACNQLGNWSLCLP